MTLLQQQRGRREGQEDSEALRDWEEGGVIGFVLQRVSGLWRLVDGQNKSKIRRTGDPDSEFRVLRTRNQPHRSCFPSINPIRVIFPLVQDLLVYTHTSKKRGVAANFSYTYVGPTHVNVVVAILRYWYYFQISIDVFLSCDGTI